MSSRWCSFFKPRFSRPRAEFNLYQTRFRQEWRQGHTISTSVQSVLSPPSNIAILGGGLTGLVVAVHLSHLLPAAKLTLYESSDRVGGWLDAEVVPKPKGGGSVTMEHGARVVKIPPASDRSGDQVAFAKTLALLESNSIKRDRVPPLPRYVYYPDHLIKISMFSTSRLLAGIWIDALRALKPIALNRLVTPHDGPYWDQSVGDVVDAIWGPGSRMAVLISSLLAGIYGGDPYSLSARSAVPMSKVLPAYLDMLDRGALRYGLRRIYGDKPVVLSEKDYNLIQLHTDRNLRLPESGNVVFSQSTSGLVNALVSSLCSNPNFSYKLRSRIECITYSQVCGQVRLKTVDGMEREHQKVVSTLLSSNLAKIVQDSRRSTTLLPALAETESVTILTINVWYPKSGLVDLYRGFGFLISPTMVDKQYNPEGVLGVLFDSHINPRRWASENGTNLTILLGGHHWKGVPIAKLPNSQRDAEHIARSCLERYLGISRDEPAVITFKLCTDCIPQHTVGHRERMARAHGELMTAFAGRLAVAGPSYTRPGVMGAIRAGMEIAYAIADPIYSTSNSYSSIGDTGLQEFVGYEKLVTISGKQWAKISRQLQSMAN